MIPWVRNHEKQYINSDCFQQVIILVHVVIRIGKMKTNVHGLVPYKIGAIALNQYSIGHQTRGHTLILIPMAQILILHLPFQNGEHGGFTNGEIQLSFVIRTRIFLSCTGTAPENEGTKSVSYFQFYHSSYFLS
jgi:hypothetical protein